MVTNSKQNTTPMKTIRSRFLLLAIGMLALATAAHANFITGDLYEGVSADATPANIPAGAPDVTFSVNSPLNFNSTVGGDTVGGFLASGGATILTGASHAGDNLNNTLITFQGLVSVVHGQTFTVTHDDGLTLIIGGSTVINAPGPTSPAITTETYNGPTGNEPFLLVYGETHGPPAVLQVDLPLEIAVPEPTTIAAGAMVLLPFGASSLRYLRKRK